MFLSTTPVGLCGTNIIHIPFDGKFVIITLSKTESLFCSSLPPLAIVLSLDITVINSSMKIYSTGYFMFVFFFSIFLLLRLLDCLDLFYLGVSCIFAG